MPRHFVPFGYFSSSLSLSLVFVALDHHARILRNFTLLSVMTLIPRIFMDCPPAFSVWFFS